MTSYSYLILGIRASLSTGLLCKSLILRLPHTPICLAVRRQVYRTSKSRPPRAVGSWSMRADHSLIFFFVWVDLGCGAKSALTLVVEPCVGSESALTLGWTLCVGQTLRWPLWLNLCVGKVCLRLNLVWGVKSSLALSPLCECCSALWAILP